MSKEEKQFSRRDFLKTTGAATGGIIGGSLLGGFIGYGMDDDSAPTAEPDTDEQSDAVSDGGLAYNNGYMFFTKHSDRETIEAAMERIFPEDDLGPGATALGAAYFLDGQLAGDYGSNAREYMQGPFYEGLPTQGYQSRLNRREFFTLGIERLNAIANEAHDADFRELEPEQMDDILTQFQEGEADLNVPADTATSSDFFELLRTATLEGVYSDPIYRGNRGMEGWKMKNFPGHQMAYIDEIEDEEFHEIDPMSVADGHN